ncbi:hypothetical protein ACNI3Q_02605 [Sphingomonas sp. FW199]|uniref:hypothetical protein n=1 Tax=Sphingomonas sp. FW199 TaxID=3400217 RepID=UPI003CF3175B
MKAMMMRSRMLALVAPLALIVGCSGGDEPPPPEPANDYDMELINEPAPPPVEAPAPAPTAEPAPPPVAPESDFRDSQQVQEDAEATGMTSRIDRSAPPAGEGEPPVVDDAEPKDQ